MEEIIIKVLISVITAAIISISGYFFTLVRKENKRRFDVLEHRLDNLSSTDNKYKDDNKVIIKTLFAVLDGLVQMGANGMVKETRDELRKHLIDHKE